MDCKCVICGEVYQASPVHGSRREKIVDEEDESLLHKQLSIILLLRKVLQLRPSHLEALLQECGNPGTWGINMCPPCNRVFLEAEFVHERLQQLHIEFDKLCKRLRTQLRASVEDSNIDSSVSGPRRKTRRGCKSGRGREDDSNLRTSRGDADELNLEILENIRSEFLKQGDESTSQANNSSVIRVNADGLGSRYAEKGLSLTGDDDEWPDIPDNADVKHSIHESTRGKEKKHGRNKPRAVQKTVKFSKDIDKIADGEDEMFTEESPNSPAVSDTMEDSAMSPEWTPEDGDYDSTDDRKKEGTESKPVGSSLATSTDSDNGEGPDKNLPAVPPKSKKCKDGFFKCPLCNKCNPTRRSSDAHIRKSHYGERLPYHCHLCPKQTVNESRMENHLIDVHKISDPLIEEDVDSDENNDSIEDDQKKEETINEYEDLTKHFRCDICPPRKARFRTARSLAAHNKQVHMGIEKPYDCEHCDKSFRRFSGWKDHQRFHERQFRKPTKQAKKRYCEQCDQHFKSWNAVKFHFLSKAHTDDKRFICELCPKSFYSQTTLDSHRGSEHHSELGLTPFQCQFCKKILGTKRNLDNHVRSLHTNETTHKCPHCPRGFMFAGTLNNHINAVHKKSKLFLCPYCPNMYPLRQYLNQHMRIHTGEKPYKCKICSKDFADKPTYNRHVEAHGDTVHECPVENCKKRYKTRHAFRIHMKSHDKTGMKYKEYLKSLQSAKKAATDVEDPSESHSNNPAAAPSSLEMKTSLTDESHDNSINRSQCIIAKQELESPQPGTSNFNPNPNNAVDDSIMPHLTSQAFYSI